MIAMSSRDKQASRAWRKLAADMEAMPSEPEELPDYDVLIELYKNQQELIRELQTNRKIMRSQIDDLQKRKPAKRSKPSDREKWLEAEVKRLEAENAALRNQEQPDGATYNNRPVISPAEAASRLNVHPSTIYRYCENGHWQAVHLENNRWLIYDDQPLTPRPRGRKKGQKNAKR